MDRTDTNTPKTEHDVKQGTDEKTGEHVHQTPDPHKLPTGTKPPEHRDQGSTRSKGGNN